MKIPKVCGSICRTVHNHGFRSALHDIALRGLNRFIYYKTLQFLVTEHPDRKWMNLPPHLRFVHLERSELLAFAKNVENELDLAFVNSAISKGDDCYGIIDGGTLANYGWYSRKPTSIDNDGLLLEFDPRYIYMYKGFTLDRYRGQRLHAINKTRALREYTASGCKGMLSYVETNNFNSLKSGYRMGARPCGRIRLINVAGRYSIRADSECDRFGLTVHHGLRASSSIARALIAPDKRSRLES